MRLVKRYQELIERDPNDISILWKLLQMLFYLVSAVAGYVTTYAFYTFQDILNHRCILWAVPSLARPGYTGFFRRTTNVTFQSTEPFWQNRLNVKSKNELPCSFILMISILSCACGVLGFSFFLLCGRGGHQVRMYSAPWRLVVPAIIFNFFLSLLSLGTAYDFKYGFEGFQSNLNKLLNESGNGPLLEFLQTRIKNGEFPLLWKCFNITKISSSLGAAGWILGLALLILRVANVTDFRLLKVYVYAPKPRPVELKGEPRQRTEDEPEVT